jgi:hypothetical protein
MKAHIYQINIGLDDKHICFMPYETILREYGDHFPDSMDYIAGESWGQ